MQRVQGYQIWHSRWLWGPHLHLHLYSHSHLHLHIKVDGAYSRFIERPFLWWGSSGGPEDTWPVHQLQGFNHQSLFWIVFFSCQNLIDLHCFLYRFFLERQHSRMYWIIKSEYLPMFRFFPKCFTTFSSNFSHLSFQLFPSKLF